ncbi:MAG: FG-GAP-like repeat-containing protein [Pirellulales bacterium]
MRLRQLFLILSAASGLLVSGCHGDPSPSNSQVPTAAEPHASGESSASPRGPTGPAGPPAATPGGPTASPAAPVRPARPDDWFADVTSTAGVHFTYRNGREAQRYYLIESFGGGVGCVDFDRDGDVDLFFTGGGTITAEDPVRIGGRPSALYRNAGGFQFGEVTDISGLAAPPDYAQGCAVADFDVDGFPDLLVCCYGRNRLYRNLGDGTFVELPEAFPDGGPAWSTTATFADLDRDGWPDLFVAHYADWSPERDVRCVTRGRRDLCGPSSYAGTSCRFLRNLGTGKFEDQSSQCGLAGNVHGLAVVAADLDLDGRVDIYVASDTTPNQLYLGRENRPWPDAAPLAGVDVNEWGQAEGSMGVDIADYDGDGQPDIWVTNYELEDNALYRNQGGGRFQHATVAAGLAGVSRMRVGFGTTLADFDHDGWPDLFVFNGNPIYEAAETPFRQRSQLFRNGQGRFTDVSEQGGTFFHQPYSGRGSAAADLDNDGALDLIVVPQNEPVRLLRNQQAPANYVSVQLRALGGEPEAIGARVRIRLGDAERVQFVTRGTSFFSQPDVRLLFALPADLSTIDIVVDWLDRGSETFRNLTTRSQHWLLEGQGERHRE